MEIEAGTLAVCGYPDRRDWFSVPDPQVRQVVRSANLNIRDLDPMEYERFSKRSEYSLVL